MTLNYILFFGIPLMFGIFLFYKDSRIFLTIFTFSCMLAFTANTFGIYKGYWNIYPYNKSYFSYIPLNIGLYPIFGTCFIYLIHRTKINKFVLLLSFSFISTVFKWIMLYFGRVAYGNGWNLYYSFISFFVIYYLGYLFYLALKKKKIII